MQADAYVTSSRVYVRVKELLRHCDKFKANQGGVSELAAGIKRQLLKSFGNHIDNHSPRFNAHFVFASLRDPAAAFMVDMGLSYVISLMAVRLEIGGDNRDASDNDSVLETAEDESFEETMLRKRKAEKRRSSELSSRSSQTYANNESGRYLQSVMRDVDAIRYWINEGKAKFPTAALDYLTIPATSAPVERSFSAAGLALDGKKSSTKTSLLNNKLMIYLNNHLL